MAIIDDFVKCYKNQYSEYDMIRKRVESVIEKNLRDSGIMAITSSRVKDAGRLREKLLLRQKDAEYNTFEDIENDIVDFVGVRIALYFPNDQKKVDSLIHYLFDVEKTKSFPNEQRSNNIYSRRFSGYCATHYRVFEKENMSNINFSKRIRVEIQVASLLMHAWSEVEHDLTYKQKKGLVSFDEYESLDEINGLVIAGEISLQRLQRISELRITSESKVFSNHFQLASYIYDRVEGRTTHGVAMGDVETLFSVLKSQGRLTPKKVDNDLQKIDYSDTIPIAQQLIDMYADSNMDCFRKGELSSKKENIMIEEYKKTGVQVILSSTLKDEEYSSGTKYYSLDGVNAINYESNPNSHILQSDHCDQFMHIINSFGVVC